MKTFDRGTLSGSTITGTPNREQDFTLNQLGGWSSFLEKTSGTTTLDQDRTFNAANEITGLTENTGSAWVDPTYDAVGNMTLTPLAAPGGEFIPFGCTYYAWSRLVNRVEDCAWSSLHRWSHGWADAKSLLTAWPLSCRA